ncbi:MAG: NUDIX hydrolase [Chlamydiia bacterium]|nr:NUDIX hydrolase [Chlamydiia bacterium]
MSLTIYDHPPAAFVPELTIVGCYCLFEGKFLIVKRAPECISGETWCLPGGKLEEGESRIEGAQRELHEEVGVELLPKNLSHLITLYLAFPNFCYDFSIYHCTFPKKPLLHIDPREHTEARWVTHEEAKDLPLIHGGETILDYCLKKHEESPITE